MRFIDLHTHAISADPDKYPVRPLGGERSSWSASRPVTVEELLRSLDAADVEKAALVQASTCYGFDNSYAADSLEGREDRLVGVCSVDFFAPDVIGQIRHWVSERNFSGVRLRAADGTTRVPTPGEGLDDPRMNPVWAYLQDSGMPVCVQMHSRQAASLAAVLSRFPKLVIALDHAARPRLDGGPPYSAAAELFGLTAFDSVFLKITPVTILRANQEPGGDARQLIRTLVDGFGADKVAWGSNFPASAGTLPELRQLVSSALEELTEDERRNVLGQTAARIYPRLAS